MRIIGKKVNVVSESKTERIVTKFCISSKISLILRQTLSGPTTVFSDIPGTAISVLTAC
jgi:hypothetical protein